VAKPFGALTGDGRKVMKLGNTEMAEIQNANSDYGSSVAKRLYSSDLADEIGWMHLQGITVRFGMHLAGTRQTGDHWSSNDGYKENILLSWQ